MWVNLKQKQKNKYKKLTTETISCGVKNTELKLMTNIIKRNSKWIKKI